MWRLSIVAGILLVLISLAACATLEAETPAQKLFAAQAEFNIHQRVVLAYVSQPECGAEIVVACARPDVKAALKSMAVRIRSALAAARATLQTPHAENAVAAVALMVRELATYLARKELDDESADLTSYPPTDRPDRAWRHARA